MTLYEKSMKLTPEDFKQIIGVTKETYEEIARSADGGIHGKTHKRWQTFKDAGM